MSFVPLHGAATFEAASPPRDGAVTFTDGERRVIRMPIRGALPVLTRAHRRDDLHPTVRLLSGAAILAMQLVADGKIGPHPTADHWRMGPLGERDEERLTLLAGARAYPGLEPEAVVTVVRELLDAVADAMPRSAPRRDHPLVPVVRRDRTRLLAAPEGRVHQVSLSLRIEADDEDLVHGRVRVVLQAHDAADHAHVVDAARLWTDRECGFSGQARVHLTTLLRRAAQAWDPLDRLQALQVPDEITLEGDEVGTLLDGGIESLAAQGVDVMWPRSMRRDLTAQVVVERRQGPADEPLVEGLFGPQSLFAFNWQVALGDDPLSETEMDELASATTPIIRLRDNWMVVDPALARRARRRLGRPVKPGPAIAAALTGVATIDGEDVTVVVGRSLEAARDRIADATSRMPLEVPAGLAAHLRDYQRQGLTWLAELTGLGLGACLADDMGLGKTVTLIALHLHRKETLGATGPTLVVCPASLLGNWEQEIRRFAPGVAVRRFHGTQRSLAGD